MVTEAIHNRLKVPGPSGRHPVHDEALFHQSEVSASSERTAFAKVTIYTVHAEDVFIPPLRMGGFGRDLIRASDQSVDRRIFRRIWGSRSDSGGNEQVIISQGMNPSVLKLIGIGLSNGLIALSGGLLAQYQGFADANLGQGMVVQGLAAIMLGEFLFSSNKISLITLRAVFGAIIYKGLMFFGRKYGYLIHITPNDFKLLTGILVIASLLIAQTRSMASSSGRERKRSRGAWRTDRRKRS
jgi:putative ABC transport system permease protein